TRGHVVAGGGEGPERVGAGPAGPVVGRGCPGPRGHRRPSGLGDRDATDLPAGPAGRIVDGGRPDPGGARRRGRGPGPGGGDGRALLRGGAAPTPRRVAAAARGRRGPTVSGRAGRGTAPRSRPARARRGGSLFSPGSHHRPRATGQIAGTASRDES